MMFKSFEEITVGQSASISKKITAEDIKKFVEITGDNNPLHVDRGYAETTSFKDVVVHGMLGASFISTVIGTRLPGRGALWISQSLEFLMPVRLNDELVIVCTVLKKHERDRILELETNIWNQNKTFVLSGKGRVKVLESSTPKQVAANQEKLKVAVVTGGSGGIGKAICLQLAQEGYRVVVNYLNNEARALEIVGLIESQGGESLACRADISKPEEAQRLVDRAVQKYSGISLLVNNASPKIQPKAFESLEWEEIMHHLNVQFRGAFEMSKVCVPIMKAQGYGKIVNITSQVLDSSPSPTWTAYAIGKSSLATFSRYLAVELGPFKITVNCVSPGMTDTALIGDIPEKARLIIARQTPLRKLASPEDVAGSVGFLASPQADHITGETIRVNGGMAMV